MSDAIFHRGAPDRTPEEQRRHDERVRERTRRWIAATDRLCANGDFGAWLYGVMDDLGLFDRPEAALTDFGQGFRAAANRIRNRMLEAPKAVELFCALAKRHHSELHRRLVAERGREGETERKDTT